MRLLGVLGVLCLSLCIIPIIHAADNAVSLLDLTDLSKTQINEVLRGDFDIVERSGDAIAIVATLEDRDRLESLGVPYTVRHQDLKAFYRSRYSEKDAATMGGFKTFSEIVAFLDSLAAANPAICSPKYSIGQTVEGREQWMVKISDNYEIDEDEPEVFYNSLIHAREPAGAAALMGFMKYLCENYGTDPEVTDVVNNRELFCMVVTNPDGYVYNETTDPGGGGMWRQNRRDIDGNPDHIGVDLNRNYSYEWGYDDGGSSPFPGELTYRGPSAFSEPETQNLRDFVISRDFVIVNNIHTYSNLVLWAWGYDRFYTEDETLFSIMGDSMTQYSGYTPTVAWGLYPANGVADDWMYGDTILKPRLLSFTTEIGGSSDGFWPSPSRIPTLVQENIYPNFFLARIADNPYRLLPPNAPSVLVPDTSSGAYDVSWSVQDSVNPAVLYRLMEYEGRSTVTDDAETDNGYWDTDLMSLSTNRQNSGLSSWHTAEENNSVMYLEAKLGHEVLPDEDLVFWTWYDIEADWDYFYVQVSPDNGENWEHLSNELTTETNPNGNNIGNGITGSSGDWVEARFDISAFVGEEILVRLAYHTDQSVMEEGVYIDDIENVDIFSVSTEVGASLTDTLTTFSGKTAGDYWYQVQATDAEGQASLWSNLVKTTVLQSYVLGDCNGDLGVDISDLTFLVTYLFMEGPAPVPEEAADLNCVAPVDISDLTRLVNHLFVTFEPLGCE